MIRAILFDLGNTLLEYEARPSADLFHDVVTRLREQLVHEGTELPDEASLIREFDRVFVRLGAQDSGGSGSAVLESLAATLESAGVSRTFVELPAVVEACYRAVSAQVVVYPDTLSTLIELKQAGLRLGVVANTVWPKELHRRDLARFEMLSLFDGTWFSSDLGVAKPDPAIFARVLGELDVEAEEAIYVGDDPATDIAGAQAAGIRSVLKFHPLQSKLPRGVRPDAKVDALNRLPALVESWNPALA